MPLIKLPKLRKGPKLPPMVVDFLDAYNGRDLEGMLANVSDDLKFRHYCDAGVLFKAENKAEFDAALREDLERLQGTLPRREDIHDNAWQHGADN
jgi:hypothetical protein